MLEAPREEATAWATPVDVEAKVVVVGSLEAAVAAEASVVLVGREAGPAALIQSTRPHCTSRCVWNSHCNLQCTMGSSQEWS